MIDKEILGELHRQEFKRDYYSRSGGGEMAIYVKQVGSRLVDVQLWDDGAHRVSHMLDGRMSTLPSGFHDAAEMKIAIQHELTRADHAERR